MRPGARIEAGIYMVICFIIIGIMGGCVNEYIHERPQSPVYTPHCPVRGGGFAPCTHLRLRHGYEIEV